MAGLSIAVVLLAVGAEGRCSEAEVQKALRCRSQQDHRYASYYSFETVPGRVVDAVCCIEGISCAARRSRGGRR